MYKLFLNKLENKEKIRIQIGDEREYVYVKHDEKKIELTFDHKTQYELLRKQFDYKPNKISDYLKHDKLKLVINKKNGSIMVNINY